MKNTKYKLTEEFIIFRGKKLYRIKALKNFGNVKTGDIGGFIESEENLSIDGDAWVFDNARVSGDARVNGDTNVSGNACIFDNAEISGNASVSGNALVYGKAKVHGYSYVYENARVGGDARVICSAKVSGNSHVDGKAHVSGYVVVYGNALVSGKAHVSGDAIVSGNAKVFGNVWVGGFASVSGNAKLEKPTDILVVGVIGSRKDYTTFFKGENNDVLVNCGCFQGTVEEFEKVVKKTHKGNFHEKQYMAAVKLAKISILEEN